MTEFICMWNHNEVNESCLTTSIQKHESEFPSGFLNAHDITASTVEIQWSLVLMGLKIIYSFIFGKHFNLLRVIEPGNYNGNAGHQT